MSILTAIKKARLQNLVNGQERVIKLLNVITQEHADLDVLEFIDMYRDTKKDFEEIENPEVYYDDLPF